MKTSELIKGYLGEALDNTLEGEIRSFVQSPSEQGLKVLLNAINRRLDWMADGEEFLKSWGKYITDGSKRSKSPFAFQVRYRDDFNALIKSGLVSYVSYLTYMDDGVGDKELILMANSPHIINIKGLTLFKNGIRDQGVAALAKSPYAKNIEILDLKDNLIGDEGAIALASSPHLKSLKRLDLSYNQIGDKGAKALANSPNMKNIMMLTLFQNKIGDKGLHALSISPYLSSGKVQV